MRKGLFLLSLLAFLVGLCYVLVAQPSLFTTVTMLGITLVLCFLTALKGV